MKRTDTVDRGEARDLARSLAAAVDDGTSSFELTGHEVWLLVATLHDIEETVERDVLGPLGVATRLAEARKEAQRDVRTIRMIAARDAEIARLEAEVQRLRAKTVHSADLPFADVVSRRTDGGVDIDIDHPRGPLRWELPGERAAQLRDAIHAALVRPEADDEAP